jgi:intein/homing endonuclease
MAIIDLGGKVRSEQTKEEITNLLTKEFANLNEEEKKTVLLCLKEMDDAAYNDLEASGESSPTRIYDVITNAEYIRKPVDIETFIRDPYFLGKTCDSLYPRLLDDIKELFTGNYRELILSGSIGWGKCLNISSTYVNTYPTGERVLLADLIGKEPLIASLNENNIQPELAAKIWHSGSKECARMTLASGQWLEASLDHPVLTPHGYVQLGKLNNGGLVCVARTAPEPAMPLVISDEETQAVAFYIADGCALHESRAEYCKGNLALVERFEEAVSCLPGFNGFGQRIFDRGAWKVRPHGLLPWIRSWGLDEMSKHKRIPSKIFSLPRGQLALFIRTLWADGNVYTGKPRKIEIAMASELLIDDLQAALRRFRIVGRKNYAPKSATRGGVKHDVWRLQISDVDTIGLFLNEIGDVLGSEDKCAELREQLKTASSNTNWDIVPITTEELKKIRESLKVSRGKSVPNQEWSKFGLLAKGSYMSRSKFQRLVEHFGYKGPFAKYAFMDVVWEKVTEIKPIGVHPVADLTVPSTKNVVANGIIVHNTFFASIAACRIIYELSCMRDPQKSFGISSTSDITMVVFSVNEEQAIKVAFENIISKVKESEYFKEHFPFKPKKEEILFPNKIQIAARATTDSAALGLNVFSAFMDECLHGDSLVLLGDGSEVKARELYEKNTPFNVHTFDFKENVSIASEAFIKQSTGQECFELLLDSGECLKASGTHPVAVRRGDKLVFIVMSDILDGEEVVRYGKMDRGKKTSSFSKNEKLMERWSIFRASRMDGRSEKQEVSLHEGVNCKWVSPATSSYGWSSKSNVWKNHIHGSKEKNFKQTAWQKSKFGNTSKNVQVQAWEKSTLGEIQKSTIRKESNSYISTLRRVQEENFREQHLEANKRGLSLSWPRRNEKSWENWFQKSMGASRSRYSGAGYSGDLVSIREAGGTLHPGRKYEMDSSGFQTEDAGWINKDCRGETKGVHVQCERKSKNECRNDALQGARLGIRGMGRELSVARVVSKKALGSFPTYDISVPGKEVFIADGVLVHNTNFMAPMKKKNGISGKAGSQDRAQYLYDQLFRRMKSRFQRHGKLPGMMIVVSSKQTKEDFTAKRISDSKDDPTVFVRDYCLSGDTKIPLLDGTVLAIKELAEKYNGSEERFLVYSYDLATQRIVAGKAHHPRLTKKNEKIIKITLDDGESVRATAWHPFLMRSGEYKKAGDLVEGDSIMPLYLVSQDRSKMECLGLGLMGLIRKVVKIEDDGTSDVYDLSVEKYENFGLEAGVFVKNSTWDAKPEGTYSSEKFQVLVGNELVPSKILLPEEVEIARSKLQDGMLIIDVPVDFKHDFTANLEGSIMDTAGIATVSISPFIQQRDAIVACIDPNRHHPFTLEQWTPTESGKFVWSKIARQVDVRDGSKVKKEWQPLFYPGLPRHIHIDPSLNSDSTGFAVGCVTGYKSVVRRDEETKEEYTERAPEIWIDFVLKINPPTGGEIDHGLVRSLVYQLQDHGFFISLVTMDQFNSASSLQTFARKGISAERLSVDKPMDPYETLKTTIYENRMSFYNYEPLLQELRWIQKDNVRNKVDHPHGKSKDLADALTGVTFTLTTMYRGSPVGIIKGVSQLSNPEEEEQRDMVEDDNHIFAFIQG